MPRITFSVSQEVYDGFRREMDRHAETSVTSVVNKFATVYAKGVVYFQGKLPVIHTGKMDDFTCDVFQGELPGKETTIISGTPVDVSSVPAVNWDEVEAEIKKEKEKK